MIAIIGAGISGLSLGYYLKKNGFNDFKIFEKSDRLGGKIQSESTDNYHLEFGPNTLMTTPLLSQLISELGLNDELIHPDESITKNRFVGLSNKIKQLPSKPQQLLFTKIISFSSKIKVLKELKFKPSPIPKQQTVSDFFEIHFGKEIVEKLVKAFCRGIYGANADDLLIETCFPKLVEYQEQYGSLIKALKAQDSLEKRKVVSIKGGLNKLCQSLAEQLTGHINLNSNIETIIKIEQGFDIHVNEERFTTEKLIFCCDAKSISKLTESILPKTSKSLNNINYTALKVTHSIYNKQKKLFPYKGFGALLPPMESSKLFGHIWNSSIISEFSDDKTIITTMSSLDNDDIISKEIDTYFKNHFNLVNNDLIDRKSFDWKYAIPRYDVNHLEFLHIFKKESKIKLYICCNLTNGVSIPDRIKESNNLAKELIK